MATVLVVEKQPNMRLLMEFELADAEYQGILAANEEEAMDALCCERPDVVVLGVGWPPEDDLKTLHRMKARYPDLPVVLFASSGEVKKPATMHLGDAFLLKHSNMDALMQEIDRQINGFRRGSVPV